MPSSPNPYLAWIFEGQDPPLAASLEQAQAAHAALVRESRQALRQLKACRPADLGRAYVCWNSKHQRINYFRSWVDATQWLRDPSERSDWSDFLECIDRTWDRINHHMRDPALLASFRKALNHRCTSAVDKAFLRQEIDEQQFAPQQASRLRRQRRDYDHRLQAFEAQADRGVALTDRAQLQGVPLAIRRQARTQARHRGQPGWWFDPGAPLDTLLAHAHDETVRHAAWRASLLDPHTTAQADQVRRVRQHVATSLGCESWVNRLTPICVVQKPATLERLMGLAVDESRTAAVSLERTMKAVSLRRQKAPVDASWDWSRLQSLAPLSEAREWPDQWFPWESTARKALPELLALAHWTVVGAITKEGPEDRPVLRLRLRHATGRSAQLFYAPFDPSLASHSYAGAFVSLVRSVRSEEDAGKDQIIWLAQSLDATTRAFSLGQLTYLSHEMGHVLHYLSLKGFDDVTYVPEDVVELPSYLLQLYPRDPKVLQRWCESGRAPPGGWKACLRWNAEDVFHHRMEAMGALLDIQAHRQDVDAAPLQGLYARIVDRARSPLVASDQPAHAVRAFTWDDEYAGLDGVHILGKALVHRLVPLRADGQTSAEDIAALYTDLLESVLQKATNADRWRRAWYQWLGERPHASATQGLQAMGRHWRRVARAERERYRRHLPR